MKEHEQGLKVSIKKKNTFKITSFSQDDIQDVL